jgi:serine/threonine protein kinase
MIGQRISNYEIKAPLGEGGMGAVYLAEHPLMGRKVAIKLLKRELAGDPAIVQRFINEARAATAIRHPNIIDVLDLGILPDGCPYIVMELLEGESLGQRVRRQGTLPVVDALEIASQVTAALAAAHAKGIVHRDLKPENLFLVRDESVSGRLQVKVLDFGIAKLQAEVSGVSTRSGSVLGTPPYMSPEQCRGISRDLDHRTDVYALGIILYEMLCGTPPFVAEGFGDVLMMHMSQQPPPPRARNPQIPEALERTILRALEKKKEDRFPSMAELAGELERIKATLPRAPSPWADVQTILPKTMLLPAAGSTLSIGPAAEAIGGSRSSTTLSSSVSVLSSGKSGTAPRSPRRFVLVAGGVAGAALLVSLLIWRGGRETSGPSRPIIAAVSSVAPASPAPDASAAVAAEPVAREPEDRSVTAAPPEAPRSSPSTRPARRTGLVKRAAASTPSVPPPTPAVEPKPPPPPDAAPPPPPLPPAKWQPAAPPKWKPR